MEFKETTNSLHSVETNMQPRSERDDSGKHRGYDILFREIDDGADPIIDKDGFQKNHEKLRIKGVSTLDWLTTWRPLEIS